MTIEVKGWIAILIAYRGDSVFISRVVIMRAGRFSVDATVYHRFMHAPGSLRSFPGFKMTLSLHFLSNTRREAVKHDAPFIFGTLLTHFRCKTFEYARVDETQQPC